MAKQHNNPNPSPETIKLRKIKAMLEKQVEEKEALVKKLKAKKKESR